MVLIVEKGRGREIILHLGRYPSTWEDYDEDTGTTYWDGDSLPVVAYCGVYLWDKAPPKPTRLCKRCIAKAIREWKKNVAELAWQGISPPEPSVYQELEAMNNRLAANTTS